VLKFADKIGIDYPLLIGEQDAMDVANRLGVDLVFPFTVFADRERRIVAVKIGELHEDEAAFILQKVAELNAGSGQLPAIQEQIAVELRRIAAARAPDKS
jgi:hypothetical protein